MVDDSESEKQLVLAAEKLKLRGNEHFARGEHDAAIHHFTEAIKKHPQNAILYANRTAACIAKKNYIEATNDAEHAVKIDPMYAKGWVRLAMASHHLSKWDRSIEAWNRALECLPKTNAAMTPTERAMKVQFEEGLKKAKEARTAPIARSGRIFAPEEAPWMRAIALFPQIRARGGLSSAKGLMNSYRNWKNGMDKLNAMIYAEVGGNIAAKGLVQGMEGLTNAIVGDERVFHITDTSFFRRAKHQITLESVERKGWYDVAHNETVKEEILKRLDKEGWDTVRPAIAATVRAWIFTAYIRSDPATNQRLLADDFYGRALDLCDWGRQQWPDVPRGDRGAIFELSFIRGIKRLKLENMFTEFSANWGKRSSFSQQNVTRCAESLIEDVVKDPASQEIITDISGHYELHWLRPKGSALSILGWINAEFGRAMGPAQRDRRIRTLRRAGQYYLETAEIHPVDDEQYLYCLRVALECLPEAGAPLKEILPLCKRFREVVPGVLQIWEMGSFGFRIKIWDREMEGFIEAREKAIKAGEETLESVVALPPAFP